MRLIEYNKKRKKPNGFEIEDSILTITQDEKAFIETPFAKRNLNYLWLMIIAFFVILGGRIFFLQVVKGSYFAEVSKGNRIRSIVVKSPRGKIIDRYGKILADNIPSLDAVAVPSDLPESNGEKVMISRETAKILGLPEKEIQDIILALDRNSYEPVLLKENITQDQSLLLSEKSRELRGITMDKSAIRRYESGSIFSFILGYDGKITREELADQKDYSMTDYIGKNGLEKSYENVLRGKHGFKQVEVDSLGNIKKYLGVENPVAGNDLVLNINEELQKKINDSLQSILEKTETKTAAAVAIDPRNGGVLAMVSLPSFDNNLFARGITADEYQALIDDKDLPLFNRALKGEYPPGSTIKPAVAAAALSEKTITPETRVSCAGEISIGEWRFRDWKTHGSTDIRKAIAESCDIFFYSLGGGWGGIFGLGIERMKKYENLFGFGTATGIDISGESIGLIPGKTWKQEKLGEKWYVGDDYHAAIGQGFVTATPLQLANYTAAIANGGNLYAPRIVGKVIDSKGQSKIIQPLEIRKNFIGKDVMQVVREGMRQTVVSGSAQNIKDSRVEIAGKTGTAQFGNEEKTHAWFISFAPYENPEIAMVVLVEGGGEGHSSAVPVTKEVYDWYFSRNDQPK